MLYDLSPGDVVQIGQAVTLTVVAVEDDLVHLEVASPEGEGPDAGPEGPQADPGQRGWELS